MILNLILVAGLLVTFGLALLLYLSNITISKRYLSPIFIILACEIFCFFSELHENTFLENIGFLVSEGLSPLINPLLWFYTCAIINKPLKSHHNIYHFIFPVLNLLLIVIPISISLFMKNWVWHGYQTIAYNYDYYILIENTISIIYLVISLKIIYAHQRRIKLHFSQTNFRSLEWLKKLCFGGISLILLDTGTTVYEEAFGNLSWNVGYVTIVSLCLFLFYFSFYTLKQRKVIVPSFLFEIEEAIQNTPTLTAERIYLKKLKNEEIHNSKERLLNIMSKQKFFLKPDLILPDIAKELKLTDKQTTELLKLELNTNFYDFVNQYRVEEVKTKINSGKFENFTLLAIGTESGFQSKSSFNRVFKKITGMSPSEYKKSNH